MRGEPERGRRRPRGWLAASAVAVAAVAALLAACGKKGAPLPPEPRGPLPATEVRARQIGGEARVSFVVPRARGERPSQQPVRAELVRVTYPPGAAPAGDPGAFRRRGELVARLERDPLRPGERHTLHDATLARLPGAGIGYTIRYGVRVHDPRGRPSPIVVAPDLVPITPEAAPRGLRGEPTADGIRLLWDPATPQAPRGYNVYRGPLGEPPPERPLNTEPVTGHAYLDTTVEAGQRYAYVVRVALAPGAPPREGETSRVLEITAEDRFAPASPQGLVAVQEGPAVRLFWDPSPERDLAGYRVYRRRVAPDAETSWRRLGPDPVERPLFLDPDLRVGEVASYRVSAVDRATPPNESPPSEPVEIEMLGEPLPPPAPEGP